MGTSCDGPLALQGRRLRATCGDQKPRGGCARVGAALSTRFAREGSLSSIVIFSKKAVRGIR